MDEKVEGVKYGKMFSHSSGRISGRMRFSNQVGGGVSAEGGFQTLVHTTTEEYAAERGSGRNGEVEGGTVKLLQPSNDINKLSNYAYSTSNPKAGGDQTNQIDSSQAKAKDWERGVGKSAHNKKKVENTKKGSRGSKKFQVNFHDKDEMQFLQMRIKETAGFDTKLMSTTTKRSQTSTIANKYNIDYDHMLEDEYEIIQKVE